MNESSPQISVALVTRNRPASLERTLRSLRAQDSAPFEVVVSDDSDENQAAATWALAEQFSARYVRGPRRGLYANRNHVALACRGTHIRSMDDDHEFPPGHWRECETAVAMDPNAIWIIGEFRPGQPVVLPMVSPGQLNGRGFSSPVEDRQNSWAISDGASIYPRTVFTDGNRFAEDFKFGAAYLEFGSRLYWLGYRMRLMEQTWVIHHMDENNRSFMDRQMDLASSAFAMFAHALLYQPSLGNWTKCSAEVVKRLIRARRDSAAHLAAGWRAYARRRAEPRPLRRA
ncbi:MAG TPA: glycosyltransferase family 2 protein [Humisphaera sp.]|jgi:glycosyltransferase involved in cell wall biosynthesis|nr:glycosyltransferase family 2 protein [Humisphaera sp.]